MGRQKEFGLRNRKIWRKMVGKPGTMGKMVWGSKMASQRPKPRRPMQR